MITVLLFCLLQLIPVPVDFTPSDGVCTHEKITVKQCNGSFKRAMTALEPFQRQEAYRLTINPGRIIIEALSPEGEFRARTTIEQLRLTCGALPCCTITDWPRFRHRGLMLDESRSFKGVEFIKKQIDAMALLKLNVLHLHLDDSAGWRIQIDSYPDLTAKTAWRIGWDYFAWEKVGYKFSTEGAPEASGGFYSKADLKEIVAYAAERFITVIPEIEMPGHSMEVGYAYPEVLCTTPQGKVCRGAWDLCPGSEATFTLMESVLNEVMDIFPSPFIHIGGDEATMKTWHDCPKCRARMEQEGYTDVKQLQGYLIRRIESVVRKRGRRIIGWDEILETGVSRDAVIQSWRGTAGGVNASKAGHEVVMSPNTHCYYNYYQDLIRKEPAACGELVSLRFTYGYEPVAPDMDPLKVRGVQANLWCEYIPAPKHAEYMLYPRLFALAETAWSPPVRKEYKGFRKRARKLLETFKALGYKTFDMDTESDLARSGMQRFPPEGIPIIVDDE